jgi:hypothetical protein
MAIVSLTVDKPFIVLMRRSGFGDPLVLPGQETITYDDGIYDVQEGDTVAGAFRQMVEQAAIPQVGSELEGLRADRYRQLEAWWDAHPGIEVQPGIILPIQEEGRTVNRAEMLGWLQAGNPAADLKLVDRNTYTVVLPGADVMASYLVFRDAFTVLSQHWDAVHQSITNAATIPELLTIQIYPQVAGNP